MVTKFKFLIGFASVVNLAGCTAPTPNIDAGKVESEKITAASAQRVSKGMTSAAVAEILGTPNVITTNEDGSISWVFDKQATFAEAVVGTEIFRASGVTVSGSKTLMIYIVFNKEQKVESIKFRATSY